MLLKTPACDRTFDAGYDGSPSWKLLRNFKSHTCKISNITEIYHSSYHRSFPSYYVRYIIIAGMWGRAFAADRVRIRRVLITRGRGEVCKYLTVALDEQSFTPYGDTPRKGRYHSFVYKLPPQLYASADHL